MCYATRLYLSVKSRRVLLRAVASRESRVQTSDVKEVAPNPRIETREKSNSWIFESGLQRKSLESHSGRLTPELWHFCKKELLLRTPSGSRRPVLRLCYCFFAYMFLVCLFRRDVEHCFSSILYIYIYIYIQLYINKYIYIYIYTYIP